ncbi:hypothetical protein D3C86_1780270 [compost metagenome]
MNDELNALAAAKDPTSYSWVTYLWVFGLSLWGGTVRFLNQIKHGEYGLKRAFVLWAAGACTSIFVGVLTFYICEATKTSQLWTAVFVALAGHMGAEGIRMMQTGLASRLAMIFGRSVPPASPDKE